MSNEVSKRIADYTPSFPSAAYTPQDFRDYTQDGIAVVGESFTVPGSADFEGEYLRRLAYVPFSQEQYPISVTVAGVAKTVVPYASSPSTSEVALSFIDGRIKFNSAHAGEAVVISYTGKGSALGASALNQIGAELAATQEELSSGDYVSNGGSSTDNALARWDGSTSVLQDSGAILDDSDNLSGLLSVTATGKATLGSSSWDGTALEAQRTASGTATVDHELATFKARHATAGDGFGGYFSLNVTDAGATLREMARLGFTLPSANATTGYGALVFETAKNDGSPYQLAEAFRVQNDVCSVYNGLTVNSSLGSIGDLIVRKESSGNALFVDASSGNSTFGGNVSATGALSGSIGSFSTVSDSGAGIQILNESTGTAAATRIRFDNNDASCGIAYRGTNHSAYPDTLVFECPQGEAVSMAITADEQVLFGDGSSASPSISFLSDIDSGLFLESANTIGLALEGAELCRFVSTTTGPSVLVGGTASFTSGVKVQLELQSLNNTSSHIGELIYTTNTSDNNADSRIGLRISATESGAMGGGGSTLFASRFGIDCNLTSTGAMNVSSVGQRNLYGIRATVTNTGADTSASTSRSTYGGYFTATGSTAGTASAYGVYASASGADTNWAVYGNAGAIGAPSGTAALPSFAFTTDPDTGMYRSTTNTIGFAAGGTAVATLASGALSLVEASTKLLFSNSGVFIQPGTGSPEGAVTAPVGSMFLRTDGGAGTTLYVKESGSGNTGWAAK